MLNALNCSIVPHYNRAISFKSNETRAANKAAKDWNQFEGKEIPSSMELNPIFFRYTKPAGKVLDVGMGFGKTMFDIAESGYRNLSGIDPNVSGVEFAQKEAKSRGLNADFRVGNALNLPYKNNEFDTVVTQAFWTVLVDKEDRKQIMGEIARVLKPGGIYYLADMALTEENPKHKARYDEGKSMGYDYGTINARNHQTGEIQYQARHYKFKELNEMLEEAGLKVIDSQLNWGKTRSGKAIKQHFIIAKKEK